MKALMLGSFLSSLVNYKMCDNASYDSESGRGAIVSAQDVLPFALKEKGFAVGGSSPVEMYCPNPEASLIRILSCKLFGVTDHKFKDRVYSSVNCYPKAIQSDGVLFSTANGKEFLASSSNTRVTLGLYDILYTKNADSSILMLPALLPSGANTVAIASSKIAQVAVSPKSETLSKDFTTETAECVICNGDVQKRVALNQIYSDKSKLGAFAPTASDLIANAETSLLKSSAEGYSISSRLVFDDIVYHLSESVRPDFTAVQSSLIASNNLLSDLERGAIFSRANSESLLALRKDARPYLELSSFDFTSEISSSKRVSDYWEIPIPPQNRQMNSYVWSY